MLGSAHAKKPGTQLATALDALGACRTLLAELASSGRAPQLAELDAVALKRGAATALKSPEAIAYRDAHAAVRQLLIDEAARAQLLLIDRLLGRFAARYEAAKRARSAVDYDDLELFTRDLLATRPDLRARWAGRFALLMIDEFQDTNPLQMQILSALERENLFAVGDERQSIYGFRHADIEVMRGRRAALGDERVLPLAHNFRSARELLDVINVAFSGQWGERFQPLVAGRDAADGDDDAPLRLFDPDRPLAARADNPPVELLLVEECGWEGHELGLEGDDRSPARRAEARAIAERIRALVAAGRRPRDIVVLVRATTSLRLFEQALEERGLPTYVVGGRGYWSREQVRDGIAYLAALANPLDEASLHAVLASPFAGVGADALVLAALAGREEETGGLWAALRRAFVEDGDAAGWPSNLAIAERERLRAFCRFFAAEREQTGRHPMATLLDRAVRATGYDTATLRRPGGDRRLANLRKLIRLARDFEVAEGRDLRGFVEYANTQQTGLTEAREGDAPLESEDLDAVRLMTIHRAKGLEFPVVVVPDLGRKPAADRGRLLVDGDRVGLRVWTLEGDTGKALAYEELADEAARADDEEERRLFYVAMTRAEEQLILSGSVDTTKWPPPQPGAAPIQWLAPALIGDPAGAVTSCALASSVSLADGGATTVDREWDGRRARIAVCTLHPKTASDQLPAEALRPAPRPAADRAGAAATVLSHNGNGAPPAPPPPAVRVPSPVRLSYTALSDYGKCGYRFYLRRVLGLAEIDPPPQAEPPPPAAEAEPGARGLTALERGSLVHSLLEHADLRKHDKPDPAEVVEYARGLGMYGARHADGEDAAALVHAFLTSALATRLANARELRREAPFAFVLPGGGAPAPLVNGYLDVVAKERDGRLLIVDYKTDRIDPDSSPEELIERDYEIQRVTYALAGLRHGAPEVEVVYALLERPEEPVSRTFTARDEQALTERLATLAAGVVGGRYPVTDRPHLDLCATCPGRTALCSHPPERTLSPRREPSPAAADR